MAFALQDTDWKLGIVNVRTKRTWTCQEKNALAILRQVQNLHGGDLIFDNANRTVSLLTFSGTDSGALEYRAGAFYYASGTRRLLLAMGCCRRFKEALWRVFLMWRRPLHRRTGVLKKMRIRVCVTDREGSVWFTDLMLQEGDRLSGYVINTDTLLKKHATGDEYAVTGKRFYNGIIRGSATCVIFNLGTTSTGLDWKVIPNQNMKAQSISPGLGEGAHKATFNAAANAGDELNLLASSRQCLKNGTATSKDGFFQYSAAGDSKHPVAVEDKKSARRYVEFQETEDADIS